MADRTENDEPNPWLEGLRLFLLIGALFFGGMYLGLFLAGILAPESDWAAAVGFFVLPLSFMVGWKAWYAAATAALGKRLLKALFQVLRGKGLQQAAQESLADLEGQAPPGTNTFVMVSFSASLIAGGLIGLSPDAAGLPQCLGVMVAAGLGYGLLLRWLARAGYLPLPDG